MPTSGLTVASENAINEMLSELALGTKKDRYGEIPHTYYDRGRKTGTEQDPHTKRKELADLILKLKECGLGRKTTTIILTSGAKNVKDLALLDAEALHLIVTQAGLSADEKLALERVALGPILAALRRANGVVLSMKRTDYQDVESYLPREKDYPRGRPCKLGLQRESTAADGDFENQTYWAEWSWHARCAFSYFDKGEWNVDPNNVSYDWLKDNVGQGLTDEYGLCHPGEMLTSRGLLAHIGGRMQNAVVDQWWYCRRGCGDFDTQSAVGYANEWSLKYHEALRCDNFVATPNRDADDFLRGTGLPVAARRDLVWQTMNRASDYDRCGETYSLVDTVVQLYREHKHAKDDRPWATYSYDDSDFLFEDAPYVDESGELRMLCGPRKPGLTAYRCTCRNGSTGQGATGVCYLCGRRKIPEQSGEKVSPGRRSGVTSVQKTSGVASQAGATPGVKARATGKGSDRAETATGKGVPEDCRGAPVRRKDGAEDTGRVQGTERSWKEYDRKWENWCGWSAGWSSKSWN